MQIVAGEGFSGWHALNDTVMGGRSQGQVKVSSMQGLLFDGDLIEQGGGFISVRSPQFSPPLNLEGFTGLQLLIAGEGRRFKLAVACADGLGGLSELIPGGVRWVQEFSTEADGHTTVKVPFSALQASVRAKPQQRPFGFEPRFDPSRITRLQILHSKFDDQGGLNQGFRPGLIHLELASIEAMP